MRTIETNIYTFDELSDRAKEKALDKFRDWNTDHDWWDCIYDDAKADAESKGIHIKDIHFSGFYCQGSGASFSGSVVITNEDVVDLLPSDLEARVRSFRAKLRLLGQPDLHLEYRAKISDTCSHRMVLDDIEFFRESEGFDTEDEEFEKEYLDLCTDLYRCPELDQDVLDMMRDFASEIYSSLEAEYEYLTSDEAVIESIEANEREFTEEGDLV